MFWFERLVGIGIYLLALLFVCMLISKTRVSYKAVFRFYLVCLCIMAIFYEPYETADLYRIHGFIDYYSELNFDYFIENHVIGSSIPAATMLYYIVGKSSIDSLISIISVLVCYSSLFYTIRKSQEKYNISRENVAFTLFFLMITSAYMSVIGGIRMMIAISLIVLCFYREAVEGKFRLWHVFLYIVAALMHNMALFVIGIRFLAVIFNVAQKPKARFFSSVFIVGIVIMFVLNFESIMLDVYEKALWYLYEDNYVDNWEYLMGFLMIFLFIVLLIRYLQFRKEERYKSLISYNFAMVFSAILSLVFYYQFSIFYRFAGHLLPILMLPLLMIVLEKEDCGNGIFFARFSFKKTMLVYCLMIMALSFTRGSMSSLKFFAF